MSEATEPVPLFPLSTKPWAYVVRALVEREFDPDSPPEVDDGGWLAARFAEAMAAERFGE